MHAAAEEHPMSWRGKAQLLQNRGEAMLGNGGRGWMLARHGACACMHACIRGMRGRGAPAAASSSRSALTATVRARRCGRADAADAAAPLPVLLKHLRAGRKTVSGSAPRARVAAAHASTSRGCALRALKQPAAAQVTCVTHIIFVSPHTRTCSVEGMERGWPLPHARALIACC
jgi:hypothetical protein